MAKQHDGNIGCGAIMAIEVICTVLTCIIIKPDEDDLFFVICLGLFIGYIVAYFVNNSDLFKDL